MTREMGGTWKRAAVAQRPDPAGRGERLALRSRRWRPDPDGGGEWPAHGRTTGYGGNARWRTTVAVEGGK
jgi:hypothetical protein